MLIQIILLHGFHVCISIVRLNRYVIKYFEKYFPTTGITKAVLCTIPSVG